MSRIHFDKRRDFLKGAACMAASGAASTFVPQLSMMGTALAGTAPTGYKALVCIYLSGGNDSWNLLIPGDDSTNIPVAGRSPLSGFNPTPYGWYATSRGGLFQGTADRLGMVKPGGVDPGNTFLPPALGILGNQYGLNPAVPELQTLFNQGKLTFVANVGPLVEPHVSVPSIKTFRPLARYWLLVSACLPHTLTRNHVVSSTGCPVCWSVQRRLVATLKLVTAVPLGK
jgi:uncharacterized protein (DUF1501 family)